MNIRITEKDWEIIVSVLGDEATDEDNKEFQQWLEKEPDNAAYFHQLKKDWLRYGTIESYHNYNSRNAWKKFENKANNDLKQLGTISLQTARSKTFGVLKIAASFILAFGLSWILYQQLPHKSQLAEQSTFEVIVPKGEKSQLVLGDGTKVWLNSESKLTYNGSFGKSTRNVQLTGEAYFDVAHNKDIPFVVSTNNLELKVLGTEFNIREYENDNTIEATLIEGSLSVTKIEQENRQNSILLKPEEKITYFKDENKFVKTSTIRDEKQLGGELKNNNQENDAINKLAPRIKSEISWKNNTLEFDNESFAEIEKKLERWYGNEIFITDSVLLSSRYKGKFENNETIFQVLEVIKKTTPIVYELKVDKIYIELGRE